MKINYISKLLTLLTCFALSYLAHSQSFQNITSFDLDFPLVSAYKDNTTLYTILGNGTNTSQIAIFNMSNESSISLTRKLNVSNTNLRHLVASENKIYTTDQSGNLRIYEFTSTAINLLRTLTSISDGSNNRTFKEVLGIKGNNLFLHSDNQSIVIINISNLSNITYQGEIRWLSNGLLRSFQFLDNNKGVVALDREILKFDYTNINSPTTQLVELVNTDWTGQGAIIDTSDDLMFFLAQDNSGNYLHTFRYSANTLENSLQINEEASFARPALSSDRKILNFGKYSQYDVSNKYNPLFIQNNQNVTSIIHAGNYVYYATSSRDLIIDKYNSNILALGAPYNIIANPISDAQIDITWTKPYGNPTNIVVERKRKSDGGEAKIFNISGNLTTFTDLGLTANTTYQYTLKSQRDNIESVYSSVVESKTLEKSDIIPNINSINSVEVGKSINFTATFNNLPSKVLWNFEGGNPATSDSEKPSITYITEGKYDVWLTVYDDFGKANTIYKNDFVTVTSSVASNLPSLILASETNVGNTLVDAIISGNYIYSITNSANRLIIYNINSNGTLTLLNQTTLSFSPKKIAIENDKLYVLGSGKLAYFSLSNFSTPTLIAEYNNINNNNLGEKVLAVYNNTLFLANNQTFYIAEINSNSQLIQRGVATINSSTINEIIIFNNTTALLSTNKEVMTINFSNLSSPTITNSGKGFYSLQETITNMEVSTDGSFAYITTNALLNKSLYILNLKLQSISNTVSLLTQSPQGIFDVAHHSKSNSLLVLGDNTLLHLNSSNSVEKTYTPANIFIRLSDSYALSKSNNNLVLYKFSGGINESLKADFLADKTSIKATRRVNFSNTSIGNFNTYEWTFDGGSPSSSTSFSNSVTYNNAGTYAVTLKVSSGAGYDIEKKTSYITVSPLIIPDANFIADKTEIKAGESILFTDNSTNSPTSWEWTFQGGNPATSTNQNVLVSFSTAGTYTITLKAINSDGSDIETKTSYIKVNPKLPPIANFSADITAIEEGQQIQFTDLSTNTPSSWEWTFQGGNPATSTTQNPKVTYSTEGTYNVTLKVTNLDGTNTLTRNGYIKVTKHIPTLPVADFGSNTQSIKVGKSINFNDLSANNVSSWLWTFEGGTPATSTLQNPVITYNSVGVFDVTLKSTNIDGSDTKVIDNYITVLPLTPPVADFIANSQNIQTTQQVQFTDKSTNNPTSWSWTFQGGTPASSNLQNPVIQYNTAGTYSVTLNSTNEDGSNAITKTSFITVTNPAPQIPVANFSANKTIIIENQSVSFSDLSSNAPTTWAWTFQGGTPATSTDKNPTVTYSLAGTYLVSLTASNISGSNTKTIESYITVNPYIPIPPIANFSANKTTIEEKQTIIFSDLSANNPTTWSWEFEGGTPSNSNQKNPSIQYNTAGIYKVILTATNADGSDVEEKNAYITVNVRVPIPPVADFSSNLKSITVGESVSFFDRSTNGATSWSWEFQGGNPNVSSNRNPIVTYSTVGVYKVKLTATNADGSDTEEKMDYIKVNPYVPKPPVADFFANKTTAFAGEEIQFHDRSSNKPTNWNWTFEGATPSTSTNQNPLVKFAQEGVFSVKLIASNPEGSNTKEVVGYITILRKPTPPVADFKADKLKIKEKENVTFTDLSTNSPDEWDWTFEGGEPSTSILKNPTVSYSKAGTYSVTLKARNNDGFDTETKNAYIVVEYVPTLPEADFKAIKTEVFEGDSVSFLDLSSNAKSWKWTFSGASPSSSTLQNPKVKYSTIGKFDVSLVVENQDGKDELTRTQYINVIRRPTPPVAKFESDKRKIFVGDSITFKDLSTNSPTKWEWTFAGGTPSISTLQNPIVKYQSTGKFRVTLKVSNLDGQNTTFIDNYIEVVRKPTPPTVDFTTELTEIFEGQTITFKDLTTNTPTSWRWTIKGATPENATQQNPSFTFGKVGVYDVTLSAFNIDGGDTLTKFAYIKVLKVPTPPKADFEANKTTIYVGDTVTFNDLSTNQPISRLWNFEGGNPTTSTLQSPKIVYQNIGKYKVFIKVSNEDGADSLTKENFIEVIRRPTPPIVDFQADKVEILQKEFIQFQDLSTNSPTRWEWTFEKGTPSNSTLANPLIQYLDTGIFKVSLKAFNADGEDVEVKEKFIKVNRLPIMPIAGFKSDINTVEAGLSVQFTDTSLVNPLEWFWTFEGGTPSTSNEPNPIVQYKSQGNFEVSLIVRNRDGYDTLNIEDYINVVPITSPSELSGTSISGTRIQLHWKDNSNTESWFDLERTLDLEDGFQLIDSLAANTTSFLDIQLDHDTTYYYRIKSRNQFSSSVYLDTLVIKTIGDTLIVSLQLTSKVCLSGVFLSWTDSCDIEKGFIVSYENNQNLLTRDTLAANSTSYFINNRGNTKISVQSFSNNQLLSTDTLNLSTLNIDFEANTLVNKINSPIKLNVNINFNASQIEWTFEEGEPSTSDLINPSVSYKKSGKYDVKLKITDEFGCVDSLVKENYLQIYCSDSLPQIQANGFMLSAPKGGINYQWLLNGNPITAQTGDAIEAWEDGDYQVIITYSGGCTDTSTVFSPIITDLEELDLENSIKVYPNPSSGKYKIDWNLLWHHPNVIIYNSLGIRVLDIESFNNQSEIDISYLPSGLYIFEFQEDNKFTRMKVIKKSE